MVRILHWHYIISYRMDGHYQVDKLLTTLNSASGRITMHDVRKELLLSQTQKLDLPVKIIDLSTDTSLGDYNQKMKKEVLKLKQEGYAYSAFGDIFLEDLRKYREDQLREVGIKAVFPLWKMDTTVLMEEFIDLGFKAIVICTNSRYLNESFCGRYLDRSFINELPENVDPCGENGEYHTFVYDGPVFKEPVKLKIGEKRRKSFESESNKWDNEFCYCDLIPA